MSWRWRVRRAWGRWRFRASLPGDRFRAPLLLADAEVIGVRRDGLLLRLTGDDGWTQDRLVVWDHWGGYIAWTWWCRYREVRTGVRAKL